MTNCAFPPELDEVTLWLYLDGEADEKTRQHIERCTHCRERAETIDLLQKQLTGKLYRFDCPSPMQLAEANSKKLSDTERLVIEQHVRQCPHCAREVAQFRDFLINTDQKQNDLSKSLQIMIARLFGTDVNSQPLPDLGAVRGTSNEPLIFEGEGVIITLDIQTGLTREISILGQLAADDQDAWIGASVVLQQGDLPQQYVALDELGRFRFGDIPPGIVQIVITSNSGMQVQIPSINTTR